MGSVWESRLINIMKLSSSFTNVPVFDTLSPKVLDVELSNDGSGNLDLSLDTDQQLDALVVSVDGPSTVSVYVFTLGDFNETSNSGGTFTYTLNVTQGYNDGEGKYTAIVNVAEDADKNDGAGRESDSYLFASAPSVSIQNPSDGDSVASQDIISGTSSDNLGVEIVELQIQRQSDSSYWNGSSWVSDNVWVDSTASDGDGFGDASEDWEYDITGITGTDTYDVIALSRDAYGEISRDNITFDIT